MSERSGITALPREQRFNTRLPLEDGFARTNLTKSGPHEDRNRCLIQVGGYRPHLCHGWVTKRLLCGQRCGPCGVPLALMSARMGESQFNKGAVRKASAAACVMGSQLWYAARTGSARYSANRGRSSRRRLRSLVEPLSLGSSSETEVNSSGPTP